MTYKDHHDYLGSDLMDSTFAAETRLVCPAIIATNIFNTPGTAEKVADSLSEAQRSLFLAELAYYQGDINKAYMACRLLQHNELTVTQQIGVGELLGLVSIYRSSRLLYEEALAYIEAAPTTTEDECIVKQFHLASLRSVLYDNGGFPEWFTQGHFEKVPHCNQPYAYFFYAKYVLVSCQQASMRYKDLHGDLNIMRAATAVCEPLIDVVHGAGALIIEIALRLVCAIAWHDAGDDERALVHINRAIELALPDRLYAPLAEYGVQVHGLLFDSLRNQSPEAYKQVKQINQNLIESWVNLHNDVLSRKLSH